FEYIKVNDNLTADEAFYRQLTLPQSSFDLIKSRYVVPEEDGSSATSEPNPNTQESAPALDILNETVSNPAPVAPTVMPAPEIEPAPTVSEAPEVYPAVEASAPVTPQPVVTPVAPEPSVVSAMPEPVEQVMPTNNVAPTEPIIPNNNISSNAATSSIPVTPEPVQTPEVNPAPMPVEQPTPSVVEETPASTPNNFDNDKETFLKACENMFDALISKYQKGLADIERREQELSRKEQEIEAKLHNANEHLANAEARETVANIAHDNAKRVMDLSSFMPTNPDNNNQAGVI
ncbi:MAG: hypothetical protein K2J20_05620, partial [Bacilli bacterium]|nr:hypothetical protein [Bacilli bacterium]